MRCKGPEFYYKLQIQMGFEIAMELFRWLQKMELAKEAKRSSSGVELTPQVTTRLFDGLYVSRIAQQLLRERGQDDVANKLNAIKENSTPAIRLYNWNLLTDALAKLGITIDYAEKSRLLNLENPALTRVLDSLFMLRKEEEEVAQGGSLKVDVVRVSNKAIKEASNVFEFLVIASVGRFQLSVQHALNLFLDGNKFLAQLMVKGVKGSYDPVLGLLSDCRNHLPWLVETLFCVNEKESLQFFLNAIKPALISKEVTVAQAALQVLQYLYELYGRLQVQIAEAVRWMQQQGVGALFLGSRRHPELTMRALAICYSYLDQAFFEHLKPSDRSLLWTNPHQQLVFYYDLLNNGPSDLLSQFLDSTVQQQWIKHILISLRRTRAPPEMHMLITILQFLWVEHTERIEVSSLNIPSSIISFLRQCVMGGSQVVGNQAIRVFFHLTYLFGKRKNSWAITLFKTVVGCLSMRSQPQRADFLLMNLMETFKEIPSLPASGVIEPLLLRVREEPSEASLILCGWLLNGGKVTDDEDSEEMLQVLMSVILLRTDLGPLAAEIALQQLLEPSNSHMLSNYTKAVLSQFVAVSKDVTRTYPQLKQDFNRYYEEETMKRGEVNFLRNTDKLLLLAQLKNFIQKSIYTSEQLQDEAEPWIFHTFIKVERQMAKPHLAQILIPLVRNFCLEGEFQSKIQSYYTQSMLAETPSPSPKPTPKVSSASPKKSQRSEIRPGTRAGLGAVRRQLFEIKRKRALQMEKSMQLSRIQQKMTLKQDLMRSVGIERRLVEFGSSKTVDQEYKHLRQWGSTQEEKQEGIKLLNLADQEGCFGIDLDTLMKKYRRLFKSMFTNYSTAQKDVEERIGLADVWKFLKDHGFELLKQIQSQALVRKINESMGRRTDFHALNFQGFQEYIVQAAYLGFSRMGYSHLPPSRTLALFIKQMRDVTADANRSTDLIDSPQDVYFQETDVVRQYNKRLKDNPEYVLPQGYKKIKYTEVEFSYNMSEAVTFFPKKYRMVAEVVEEIVYGALKAHIMEPVCDMRDIVVARPVLFQRLKEKLGSYTGGYMDPKKPSDLSFMKQVSPVKLEYHALVKFSLGIQLGLAQTDRKDRFIAEEVAYWLDDALDAVEAGRSKVSNKSRTKVQNQLIRRKHSLAIQMHHDKIEQDKKDRQRAASLKQKTQLFHVSKKEKQVSLRKQMRKQKQHRKQLQMKEQQRKKIQYDKARNALNQKKREMQDKRKAEQQARKKYKQQYRKNVDEYFKRKKEELQEREQKMKSEKEFKEKKEQDAKTKEVEQKRKLQIELFKKEEQVLTQLTTAKQTYEDIWSSKAMQHELGIHRPRLQLFFDLLLKFEKGKVSQTGPDQIGLATVNFFALRTFIIPFLITKQTFAMIFKGALKGSKGFKMHQFEEFLFKVGVRAKGNLHGKGSMEYSQIHQSIKANQGNKSLTAEYVLDATGVTPSTYKRLMEFIVLPVDKREAESRFREMIESKSNQSTGHLLRQAKNELQDEPQPEQGEGQQDPSQP